MPTENPDAKPGPPNVLFVFADQLGATYMPCYGHPQVRMPNVDRLAGESMVFENAYTACPLCTPFRGTLLTGRYPLQTGIYRNSQRLPSTETTLAELFERGGYATSYMGKWHLAGPPRKTWVPPMERGGFADFVGWDCGHVRHVDQLYFDGDSPEVKTLPGHETDALTDIACQRLRRLAGGDKPFCAFLSYQAPHPYCDPPETYHDMYRGKELAFAKTVDHDARFTGYGQEGQEASGMDPAEWTERYFGEITHLDAAVGRLLAEVDALGLRDNTLVVFTSDHGDMGGAKGLFEKSVAYEQAARIPAIFRLPPAIRPGRTDALLSSVDFLPTLLGLCGLPGARSAEGMNYAPWMRGRADAPRRNSLVMQLENWSCIRVADAKLTLDPEGNEPAELYLLEQDPFEEVNRVDDPDQRTRIEHMQGLYKAWLAEVRTRIGDTHEASIVSPALGDARP